MAKGPATEMTTLVDCAKEVSASRSSESAITMSGSFRSVLSDLMSLTTAVSFGCDRPATAHVKLVGQFCAMYFAASFPVNPNLSIFNKAIPVAPYRTIS